jgi:hypothetical protein
MSVNNLPVKIKLQYQVRVLRAIWKRYQNNPTLLNKVWVEQEQRNLRDIMSQYVNEYTETISDRKRLIEKLTSMYCELMVSNF